MKFKVGDKVVIKCAFEKEHGLTFAPEMEEQIGMVGTITTEHSFKPRWWKVQIPGIPRIPSWNGGCWWWVEEALELYVERTPETEITL